jgi:hypothetical protein
LVDVDVKKLGRIPDRGGSRAYRRGEDVRGGGIGYDYVHSMVDVDSRAGLLGDLGRREKIDVCCFPTRAADYFEAHGISRIERVITDNDFG